MLELPSAQRLQLWQQLIEALEAYITNVDQLPVTPQVTATQLRQALHPYDFARACDPSQVLQFVVQSLQHGQIHTPHPGYFGLFNPAPTTMGIAADALVAAFNPQLATWVHSPFAIELERHVIQQFGRRFGYGEECVEGTFATGGAEANHTSVLTALTAAFPSFLDRGVRALPALPVMYISSEGHHSFVKAARLCGLGSEAVRVIPVNDRFQMSMEILRQRLDEDRAVGLLPFLIVGTAGTTSAGVIDPLPELAALAKDAGIWFHVDAAWGGGGILAPGLRGALVGIEQSDSLTFDAHKWLSVPMGAAMFVTRRRGILEHTFRVAATYMPDAAPVEDRVDPYATSVQWSRRFIGLKVFLSLAVAGWDGYARTVEHMTGKGGELRRLLTEAGWQIVNDTPFPVVCFLPPELRGHPWTRTRLDQLVEVVLRQGKSWISVTVLGERLPVLRACITNFRTRFEDLQNLLDSLGIGLKAVA